jgi:hypothetical protein
MYSTTFRRLHLIQMPNRLDVMLPPSHQIVHHRDNKDSAKHHARPVHILCINRKRDWEEARNSRRDNIRKRENVDGYCEFAHREASRRQLLTLKPLDQNTENREGVGEACGTGEKCEDGVESGSRADVDEGDGDEDDEREEDAVDGDWCADNGELRQKGQQMLISSFTLKTNLAEPRRERQSLVSTQRPCLSRCCREGVKRCANTQNQRNEHHAHGSSLAARD